MSAAEKNLLGLVLLDEPFSGLDLPSALILRRLVQELAAREKVVLFSSQDLETVEPVCSHIVIRRSAAAFRQRWDIFAIRTLFRSRQHRVILPFYLGIALGLAIFFSKAPALREMRPGAGVWYHANTSVLVGTTLMMAAVAVGARVIFSIPLEIRANRIFRVLPLPGVPRCLSAARRTVYFLAIAPVGSASAGALLWLWPLRYALEHLTVLLLLAAIIAELCLYEFQKIPFTCSYLPGKSYFHMAILAFAGLMLLTIRAAALEREALWINRRSMPFSVAR